MTKKDFFITVNGASFRASYSKSYDGWVICSTKEDANGQPIPACIYRYFPRERRYSLEIIHGDDMKSVRRKARYAIVHGELK